MSEKTVTIKEQKKTTATEKLNASLEKNKKVLIIVSVAIILAVAGYVCGVNVGSSSRDKDLAEIETITYNLTLDSSSLEDDEINSRIETALEELAPYTGKIGIVGVRANFVSGDLAFRQKDYEKAVSYWDAAVSKDKKAYTAPLSTYNKAVALEQLGKTQEASEAYKIAAENDNFVMASHAYFSYGRTLESLGKFTEALNAYQTLNDKYPDSTWADLGKTRIILLNTSGKTE